MRTRFEAGSAYADKRLTLYAVLSLTALLGALFGALCWCYGSGELSELLDNARERYLAERRGGEFIGVLTASLSGMGTFLLAEFLLGFSAIAQPLEALLPFLRGAVCGVILISVNGGALDKAALIRTSAVFLGLLISLTVTVFAAREAIYLSGRLFRICFAGGLPDGIFGRIRLYAARFVILLAASSAGALIDCGLSVLLLGRS